jgi:hypothetical protein
MCVPFQIYRVNSGLKLLFTASRCVIKTLLILFRSSSFVATLVDGEFKLRKMRNESERRRTRQTLENLIIAHANSLQRDNNVLLSSEKIPVRPWHRSGFGFAVSCRAGALKSFVFPGQSTTHSHSALSGNVQNRAIA